MIDHELENEWFRKTVKEKVKDEETGEESETGKKVISDEEIIFPLRPMVFSEGYGVHPGYKNGADADLEKFFLAHEVQKSLPIRGHLQMGERRGGGGGVPLSTQAPLPALAAAKADAEKKGVAAAKADAEITEAEHAAQRAQALAAANAIPMPKRRTMWENADDSEEQILWKWYDAGASEQKEHDEKRKKAE